MEMNKHTLIKQLNLIEHIEGGYFAETYRSASQVQDRSLMTTIYYMLTNDRPIGHFHRNKSDIMHFFNLGSPMKYLTISPAGELETFTLGPDVTQGHVMQQLVQGGYWKASILESGEFGLLSEVVAPGFDYTDMSIATPANFKAAFPHLWGELEKFVKVEG